MLELPLLHGARRGSGLEREGSEWNQTLKLFGEELKWGGGVKSSITDAHRWKELEAHSSTMAGGPLDSQGGRVGGEEEKAVEDRTVSMGWNISPWTTRQVFCLKVKSL